jgi:hypothetical protein
MPERPRGRGLGRRLAAVERVIGMRRAAARANRPEPAVPGDEARMRRLEARVEHLEAALEGLQDAVHREAVRQHEEVAELRRKTDPHAIAQALSADARRRGL